MPFDGLGFHPRDDEPRRPPPGGIANVITAVLALCLGVLPLTVIIVVDVMRYVRGA